jgi:flavin reductase (DIM6/NTAB) family NADH-FMN oxidoreductase RutF
VILLPLKAKCDEIEQIVLGQIRMVDAVDLLERVDRELWIVTARFGERVGGLVATFVNAASIAPEFPRVVVGLAKQHNTWHLVERSGAFGLHLIDEAHVDWVWSFGLRSGRDHEKLNGLAWQAGASGSPLLDEALGWLDCRVESRMDAADRTIYLAEVLAVCARGKGPPLTVQRMLQLATPEQRQELKRQRDADGLLDAERIRAWRGQRRGQKQT